MADDPLVVIKLGGSIAREWSILGPALEAIARLSRRRRLLVVPGGGPFADLVRSAQQEHQFSDETAHWMAILAMDQVAHLIADRLEDARLVVTRDEVTAAFDAAKVPVLAPYAWMRAADALPRSWHVTSDTIAAFVAGELGARELILAKAVEGSIDEMTDRAFDTHRPPGLQVRIATPATLEAAVSA